jgi:hypothetical protein
VHEVVGAIVDFSSLSTTMAGSENDLSVEVVLNGAGEDPWPLITLVPFLSVPHLLVSGR